MTVFENIRLSDEEIRCNAYVNDTGPVQKLAVERMGSSTTYHNDMIMDKELWYLNNAAAAGMLEEGCTCTIMDGATDTFDVAYVKVTKRGKIADILKQAEG